MRRTNLILALLVTGCFCLSMQIQQSFESVPRHPSQKGNLIQLLLGDSRRLIGDRLFTRADIYFHSGFYRSNFGRTTEKLSGSGHMAADLTEHAHDEHCNHGPEEGEHAGESHSEEKEEHVTTLPGPRDWIEAFGQKFYPAKHTHLDEGGASKESKVQEILPWLKLSAA